MEKQGWAVRQSAPAADFDYIDASWISVAVVRWALKCDPGCWMVDTWADFNLSAEQRREVWVATRAWLGAVKGKIRQSGQAVMSVVT